MSETNSGLFSRVIEEVWNAKNPNMISEIYAEDYVFHSPAGDFQGRDGYREIYDTYTNAFPDGQFAVLDSFSTGDREVIRYTFEGTHQGEFVGVSPSGKRVSPIMGIAIARIAGGLVVEEWAIWDLHGLMQQIGATE